MRKRFSVAAMVVIAMMLVVPAVMAASQTVVVTSNDLEPSKAAAMDNDKWFFYNDENDTVDNSLGSFSFGSAPSGKGYIEISVNGTQRRNIATYQFRGTPLADIEALSFSTFNPSSGNGGSINRSGYLNFNVDFDGSDTWQRRLVFVPSKNATVVQNEWQEWDAIMGGNALWTYSGSTWPQTAISGSTARTWNDILSSYQGVRIRDTDSWLGIRVGEPYADGYTEYIDTFTFGTTAGTTVFDFEPSKQECKNGGWASSVTPEFKNQGECVSTFASEGKAGGKK